MRDNIVVNPQNRHEIKSLNNPVALSIPGVGIFAYVEMTTLPPEIMSSLKDKAWTLQREIEKKQSMLASLMSITGELF